MRKIVDWVKIRQEYVIGVASTRELAEKHKVSHWCVRRRAALDRWVAERAKFQQQASRKADAFHVETRASTLREWNSNDLKVARVIRSRIASRLNKIALSDDIDIDELRTLSAIAESVQRVGRLALGASTDNQGMIGDPDADGLAAPSLSDAYATIRFAKPTNTDDDDGTPPSTH